MYIMKCIHTYKCVYMYMYLYRHLYVYMCMYMDMLLAGLNSYSEDESMVLALHPRQQPVASG